MLHDLGLRLDTPTVNLWMSFPDYLAFTESLPVSLDGALHQVHGREERTPVADWTFSGGTIRLHFIHSHDFATAKRDWERRIVRVHPNPVFLVAADNTHATHEELSRFLRLPFPKKMFVRDEWKAKELGEAGILVHGDFREGFNIHDYPGWFGETHYQRSLDFARWIVETMRIHRTKG
jgi:uncharacterized protein (DUF1919 family)